LFVCVSARIPFLQASRYVCCGGFLSSSAALCLAFFVCMRMVVCALLGCVCGCGAVSLLAPAQVLFEEEKRRRREQETKRRREEEKKRRREEEKKRRREEEKNGRRASGYLK
jgi:flagellar biosynthesis component FlhA